MIPVRIVNLAMTKTGFVVLLQGDEDGRTLPIFIGMAEAQAIALHLEGIQAPRPLTHDLIKQILDLNECHLQRIVVNRLQKGTFFAVLVIKHDGVERDVDCRPSDAIALAVRCHAPMFVACEVMESAAISLPKDSAAAPNEASRKVPSPIADLQTQLDQAVRDERYEDAARLRDEINRLHPKATTN